MKKYTQQEFKALPVIDGTRQCPTGDYTAIKIFDSDCSFEGHRAKDGYPFLSIAGAGSANRTTYFFNTVDGIFVRSGCFFGTLAEFRDKVLQDCAADSLTGIQYLGMADIVEKTWSK